MVRKSTCLVLLMLLALSGNFAGRAQAAGDACAESDFAAEIDKTGAIIGELNATSRKRVAQKLKPLLGKSGAGDPMTYLGKDAKIAVFDRRIETLMSAIDELGDTSTPASINCERLARLKAQSASLITVMKSKLAYVDKVIDKAVLPKAANTDTPKANAPAGQQRPPASDPNWSASTARNEQGVVLPPPPAPAPIVALPPIHATKAEGYSIEEISKVGRGFFGNISVSLANVINFAFQKAGKPTGYILGNEGGGAFLAGLRYGKGNLTTKTGGEQRIYWRGPSLGYDVGATGSRTMFLVYNLKDPKQLYGRFTGIDGSAYLVGGVGLTFLSDGKLVLAPIRSGLGLRLGASVGYLKFSPKTSWNPF